MTTQLKIGGMSCGHCVAAVTEALESVDGVERVEVSLDVGAATVQHDGTTSDQALMAAVAEEGYTAERA